MIPKIDIDDFSFQMLPQEKRLPFFAGWNDGLLSGMKRLNGIFEEYTDGANINVLIYDPGTSYSVDEEVISDYKVYKSLIDSNLGNLPSQNISKWQQIIPSFIGIKERGLYGTGKLKMEWSLNRYFYQELSDNGFVGFVQPDDPINPTPSSIFISYIAPNFPTFLIGATESESDSFSTLMSTGYVTESEDFTASSSYLFSVNIPSLVYAQIGTPDIAETIVRQFFDKYPVSGTFYNIITY